MDDLVQFMRDRLDVEEQIARECTSGPWRNAPTARHHATASGRTEEAVFGSPRDEGATIVAATGESGNRRNLANAEHIARHHPARVLAEVEAKRRICTDYEDAARTLAAAEPGTPPHDLMTGATNMLKRALQLLALPHADHPDYREEWRP
ncbi:DUF6221 family protein [Streptomyces sp. NPDC056682]|uniref:DUF6221 family protein n=1 Tax=Streptomyces sp. NPDC056682 TaxID=3345909 RepID=UPI003698AD38